MQEAAALHAIESRYRSLSMLMDERMRRQWAAAESRTYGWGGVRAVGGVIGMSPNTIRKGLEELAARDENPQAPVETGLRRTGAGREKRTQTDPQLLQALESLVEPTTRGDPQSPLRWTLKSTTQLAQELTRQKHPVSPRTVGRLLNGLEYSLQGNRKTLEGSSHPDRDAQFEYINASVKRFHQRGQPVISVDTKKKELVGAFKNGGPSLGRFLQPDPLGYADDLNLYAYVGNNSINARDPSGLTSQESVQLACALSCAGMGSRLIAPPTAGAPGNGGIGGYDARTDTYTPRPESFLTRLYNLIFSQGADTPVRDIVVPGDKYPESAGHI